MKNEGNVKLLQIKEQNVNINIAMWYATAYLPYLCINILFLYTCLIIIRPAHTHSDATCLPCSAGPVQPQPSPVVK